MNQQCCTCGSFWVMLVGAGFDVQCDYVCNGLLYHPSAQGDSPLGIPGIWSPDLV
jgi:hypothetical protein